MSIEYKSCVEVLCDVDGARWWRQQDEGGTRHFATLDEARRELVEVPGRPDDPHEGPWKLPEGTDSTVLCPACRLAAVCQELGHLWLNWLEDVGEVWLRHCRRCDDQDRRHYDPSTAPAHAVEP